MWRRPAVFTLILAMPVILPPPARAQAVEPGLSPAGDVAPTLRSAHADLKVSATTAEPPASAKKPINQVQVFDLLASQVPSHRVTLLVQERGIDFAPTSGSASTDCVPV
jgi:hypothetical protein